MATLLGLKSLENPIIKDDPASFIFTSTSEELSGCGYDQFASLVVPDSLITTTHYNKDIISDIPDRIKAAEPVSEQTGLGTTLSDEAIELFKAIKSKDAQRVSEVFRLMEGESGGRTNFDLNSRNKEGHTFLGLGCAEGSIEIVQLLIEKGADLNVSDFYSETPLQYASEFGHVTIVKLLLDKGAEVDLIEDRLSALHIAACRGQAEVVQMLIEAKCDANILNKKGVCPLHCAVSNGKREIVRLLLDAKAQVNVKGQKSARTPLSMAGEVNDIETCRLLLQHGANLNLTDKYGMTPLNVVCNRNNSEIARMFIEAGAKVNIPDRNDAYPLHYAAGNGDDDIVRLLLDNDAKVDVLNKNGESPLHLAIRRQHVHIVQLLVCHGACDVNICSPRTGITPLYVAVTIYTDPEEFEELILLLSLANSKCNLNCRTVETAETPLYRALDLDKADIALVLFAHGADPDIECPHDITIFNKACQRRGTTAFIEALTASTWGWRSEHWLHRSGSTNVGITGETLGYFMREIPVDAPMVFWNKPSLYWRVQDWLQSTLTLQQCCRLVIRGCIKDRMPAGVEQLSLPQRLKDFLMLKTL